MRHSEILSFLSNLPPFSLLQPVEQLEPVSVDDKIAAVVVVVGAVVVVAVVGVASYFVGANVGDAVVVVVVVIVLVLSQQINSLEHYCYCHLDFDYSSTVLFRESLNSSILLREVEPFDNTHSFLGHQQDLGLSVDKLDSCVLSSLPHHSDDDDDNGCCRLVGMELMSHSMTFVEQSKANWNSYYNRLDPLVYDG